MINAPVFPAPAHEAALRAEVREFLRDTLPADHPPTLGMRSGHNPEFSQALATRGWVGMALPKEYGGHEVGAVDRWIVIEELLAGGAPLSAHWLADRQQGPLIAHFGSDFLKEKFLPEICAGRCSISVGLSEPEAGSDLASVRTRATKVDGGWRLNGSKIWTSNVHEAQWVCVLCRTEPDDGDRHNGLSQLMVATDSEGITIRPIPLMTPNERLNEVFFDDVFVADEYLVGERGSGWKQVTAELVSERGGPDRYMSVAQLLQLAFQTQPDALREHPEEVAQLLATFATLRRMSFAVAVMVDCGEQPGALVPVIKDLGTTFEKRVVSFLHEIISEPLSLDGDTSTYEALLVDAVLSAPTFSLRGGTNEVLRNLIARGLV